MKEKSSKVTAFRGFGAENVAPLFDQLPVCPHQVISLTALEHPAESVALFAFDTGEGISTDIQHHDILYIAWKGRVQLHVNKQPLTLAAGECVLVPAHCAHAMEALSPLSLLQISAGEWPSAKPKEGQNMEAKQYIKNIDKATVHVLADLLSYQADKVASLTLVQRDLFTVTVMAMDKGTGVGPHVCEGDAMVLALDGVGDVMIGETHHVVKAGECIVMPADIAHAVRGEEGPFKMMLIVSKPEV